VEEEVRLVVAEIKRSRKRKYGGKGSTTLTESIKRAEGGGELLKEGGGWGEKKIVYL